MFKKLSFAVALSLMSQMVAAHSLTIQLENVVPILVIYVLLSLMMKNSFLMASLLIAQPLQLILH